MSGKRRTGGGAFDPEARGVFFIATLPNPMIAEHWLIPLDRVMEGQAIAARIAGARERGEVILFDSGAFTLANRHAQAHGIQIGEAFATHPSLLDGYEELLEAYVRTVKALEHDLWGYIELDIGGEDAKRETRKSMEALGVSPIPVYHALIDSPEYFDELSSEYDRVCIGNLVQQRPSTRKRVLMDLHDRAQAHPGVWYHALGVTPRPHDLAMLMQSYDSSGFTTPYRYGSDGTGMGSAMLGMISKAPGEYIADRRNRIFFDGQAYFHSRLLATITRDLEELVGG